ncbi:MAG: hypothetical protein JXR83_03535 [Deltaproteobacteria bacterium]|nr:hypothetical protein [Deltaproteobacteria bacterium]
MPAIAVLPVETLGLDEQQGRSLHALLQRQLAQRPQVTIVAAERVDRALAQRGAALQACLAEASCLGEVGREAGADLVLAVTMAGLGSTKIVRARLVRSAGGVVLQDLQETVEGDAQALEAFAGRLALRLFPEAARPWYGAWWFWTALGGAALIATGATAAVIWVVVQQAAANENLVHLGEL